MPEVYIHMRDADVDSQEWLHPCVTMYRDGAGGVVGFEILGAERVEIDDQPVTPQASSAERSQEDVVCRCAPTPSATVFLISERTFLKVVEASGEWQDWDGDRIAAALARARAALRQCGIEVGL